MATLDGPAELRRTRWFPASKPPHRAGWYEVESVGWRCKRMYWNGLGEWHVWLPRRSGDGRVLFGRYPGDRWRGLIEPARLFNVWQAFEERHGSLSVGFSEAREFAFSEFHAGWQARAALLGLDEPSDDRFRLRY